MKRVLGLLLAIAVMGSMSMPAFAQEKKAETKKGEGKKKAAEGKEKKEDGKKKTAGKKKGEGK
jgi:hypothetical protein